MGKIAYEDKVSVRDSNLPRINSVTADDLNEIKTSVNSVFENAVFVIDLLNESSITIVAPYDLTIISESFPISEETTTYSVDGNPYTFGDLISVGSEISITTDSATIINLAIQFDNSNPTVYFRNAVSAAVNTIYTADGSLSGNRTVNMATNNLRFHNGKFILGADLTLPYLLSVNGASEGLYGAFFISAGAAAINGYDATGSGGVFTTATGTALLASATGSGLAGSFKGNVQVQPYGASNAFEASAIHQIDATDKGILIPRMTTAQISAIPSPAIGLQVFNTDRNRFEHYNGSYWQGETKFLPIQHTSWSPVDGQTVAFGSTPFIPALASATPAGFEIIMRGKGVIRGCDFESVPTSAVGSGEAWSLYVRHNGTDYLVQTVSSTAGVRRFTNQSFNIPYVDGDIVRMIFVNPTWSLNPSGVAGGGFLILQ